MNFFQKSNQNLIRSEQLKSILFFLFVLIGVPTLIRIPLNLFSFSGFISDVLIAIIFTCLCLPLPRAFRWFPLFIWSGVQVGSYKLFEFMSRMPAWEDFYFLFDSQFVKNTFADLSFFNIYFEIIFGLATILLLLPRALKWQSSKKIISFSILSILVVTILLVTHQWQTTQNHNDVIYAQYNPIHWLTKDFFLKPPVEAKHEAFEDILTQDLEGRRYIKKGRAKNVLIVVLEGLPGSYLKQGREHFELPEPKIHMPLLSEIAESSMLIPDFIAHSHQTIRGLYSILCADVSKLSWTTPKSILLHNVSEKAQNCLPNQLKKLGFSTHYLQAADLKFMGKDRFMPWIGFDNVMGRDAFEAQGQKSNWGADDKQFLNQALTHIQSLNKSKKPWMLTLLTVGTHQPYVVPQEFSAKFSDKKQAAVAYLDQALFEFFNSLKEHKILQDTLVIVTADESHGSHYGNWTSSWVPALIFAPEQNKLPKINPIAYGLMDTTLSVLDYFSRELPKIPGRSFFRQYLKPREMVSFTADRLRWITGDQKRIECTGHTRCLVCESDSILGNANCVEDAALQPSLWFQKANWLDQNLNRLIKTQVMQFANPKPIVVKLPWQDQWADNLIGAQYLDFDAKTTTQVRLRWKILQAPPEGAKLILKLKEADRDSAVVAPELLVLQVGESSEMTFAIPNEQARSNFSFHLLAETPMEIVIEDFSLEIKR